MRDRLLLVVLLLVVLVTIAHGTQLLNVENMQQKKSKLEIKNLRNQREIRFVGILSSSISVQVSDDPNTAFNEVLVMNFGSDPSTSGGEKIQARYGKQIIEVSGEGIVASAQDNSERADDDFEKRPDQYRIGARVTLSNLAKKHKFIPDKEHIGDISQRTIQIMSQVCSRDYPDRCWHFKQGEEKTSVNVVVRRGTRLVFKSVYGVVRVGDVDGDITFDNEDGACWATFGSVRNADIHIGSMNFVDITTLNSTTLKVKLAESAVAKIESGAVSDLVIASVSGEGFFTFGGHAQNGVLSAGGQGFIHVNHVGNKPTVSWSGAAKIIVENWADQLTPEQPPKPTSPHSPTSKDAPDFKSKEEKFVSRSSSSASSEATICVDGRCHIESRSSSSSNRHDEL